MTADPRQVKVNVEGGAAVAGDPFSNVHPKHKEAQPWAVMTGSHVTSDKHGGRIFTR